MFNKELSFLNIPKFLLANKLEKSIINIIIEQIMNDTHWRFQGDLPVKFKMSTWMKSYIKTQNTT